jgi:dipeptidyl aminopeptidase/acylaminoacyl peptidase
MRLSFLLCLVPLAAGLAAQERLTPELLWQLRGVSDPQPSPDERWLLYHVRTTELRDNKSTTQLVLLEQSTRKRRQLTGEGSNFNGRWSPDGETIAFLSTRKGAPQVFTLSLAGGEARQITNQSGGVSNLAWSPGGTHLSFTAEVKLDPDVHDRHPDLPHADAKIFDSLLIRHWDEWKEGKYSHLFVVSADGGAPRDLMPGERFDTPVKPFGGGEQIAWSPDGKELCYTAKKIAGSAWASSTDNDLYAVPVDGGPARNLTAGMPGYDQDPVYSPDGSMIAFHSMARAGFEADRNRIMVLDRRNGKIRDASEGVDLSAHAFAWLSNDALVFDADVKGTTQVYRLALAGGAPQPLSQGRWQFSGAVPAPGGDHVYCVRQRTERPNEIVRLSLSARGEGEALTDENGALYANLAQPEVEERWFQATDGAKIHSWVVYPPDFDPARKWPMLLYCQGGPQSQVGQWFSLRWNFHLMAARGYVVLAVNRRGLPGFGQAWNDQISGDWGGQAMQDLLSATDAMLEEPFIDRQRTAAIGASFGGYTIYWLMGNDDRQRFCSMVAHCGVFDLRSMYLATEELFFPNWDLGGPFWTSPEIASDYQRFSPSSFVGNWRTPLLVIHGERDYRVPVTQGIQAFTAAQVRGVPSRFLYFPAEGHWVLTPQNGVLWHREFFTWLDATCKDRELGAAPASAPRKEGR